MARSSSDELASALSAYASRDKQAGERKHYADPGYWETRGAESDGVFDWYAGFQELEMIFREFRKPAAGVEVLMVGCGNSALSSEMHEAGYRKMINIDVAASAVEKMATKFADLKGLQWQVMDATAMEFEADRFDLSVDKGTLDAMVSDFDGGGEVACAMVCEVWRTLKPGATFLLVSHNGKRLPLLDGAVSERFGEGAQWEALEVRRCRLSAQATLINILRSKLNGRPLAAAFKDPEMLKEAAGETRKTLQQMQFLEAFRMFKAKKARAAAAAAAEAGGDAAEAARSAASKEVKAAAEAEPDGMPDQDAEESTAAATPADPKKQPFCWCYVLRKPLR